jgi:predicted dehydrogenase
MHSESRQDKRSATRTRRRFLQQAGTAATIAGAAAVLPRKASARVIGANDRIGVGLIGCGGEGNALMHMVNACKAAGANVQITAVCDVYRPRMRRSAEAYTAKMYDSHVDLLADSDVDAVVIATPDHIHAQQVIDAVRADKDVYCEKPVTHWRQFEITKKMVAEVKKSRRVFQLGTQYMSDSAWHQAKRLIEEGLIGKPVHVECGFFRQGDFGERGMPIDDPNAMPGPDLDWKAFLGDAPERPFDVSRFFRWRMYEDYSGGPATDLYPHVMTQAVFMLGLTFPSLATATGGIHRYEEREVPDTFHMLVEYPERVSLTLVGTQASNHAVAPERMPSRSPIIRGWDGTLTFDGEFIVFTPGPGIQDRPARRIAIERPFDHVRHMGNFLECCRTREQPYCPIDLTYHVQTAIQMASVAMRQGKTASFDAAAERVIL